MSNQKKFSTRTGIAVERPLKIGRRRILGPEHLAPSLPGFVVAGVLNAGFFYFAGKLLLVVRVDEVVDSHIVNESKEKYGADDAVPFFDYETSTLSAVPVNYPPHYDPDHDYLVISPSFGMVTSRRIYFSYLSHLRLLEVDPDCSYRTDTIILSPSYRHDCYGCEDARAVIVDNTITLIYNGLGICGSTIHRAQLADNLSVASREMILAPDQKHGCLFPHRISGQLIMATRPLVRTYVNAAGIWLYSSYDGVRWKVLGPVVLPRPDNIWDSIRVGPGAPPIRTNKGWLLFYYGVDKDRSYHTGAVLLDLKNPTQIISRSSMPLLSPEYDWELNGRRADTVFPSGANFDGKDRVQLYYGAADTCVGVATFSLDELVSHMTHV